MLLDDVGLWVRGDGRAPSFFWVGLLAGCRMAVVPGSPVTHAIPACWPSVCQKYCKASVSMDVRQHDLLWIRVANNMPTGRRRMESTRAFGRVCHSGRAAAPRRGRMCRTPMRTCVRDHRLDCSRGAPPLAATTRMRISVIRVRDLGDSGSPLRALRYPYARDHRTGRIPIRYPRAPTGSECGLLALHESSFQGRQVSGNKSDEIIGERDNTVPGIGR